MKELCLLEKILCLTPIFQRKHLKVLIDGVKDGEEQRKTLKSKLLMSEHTNNNFKISDDFNKEIFSIEYRDFRENVAEGLVLDPEGERYIKLIEAADGNETGTLY